MSSNPLQLLEPIGCPFCGSLGARLVVDPDYVQCMECGATGPECDKRGKGYVPPSASIEAWNRRSTVTAAATPRQRSARVSDYWLNVFETNGREADFPEVQAMARELLALRKARS